MGDVQNGWILHHYYDDRVGPFRSLTDLPPDEAAAVQGEIVGAARGLAGRRAPDYLTRRRELEAHVRRELIAQGGEPARPAPLSMCVGACGFLADAYERPAVVTVPLDAFDPLALSFTYGDVFPTFSPRAADGREYRGRVYTLDGIRSLVDRMGLPQDWNPLGEHGPERYIEVQVWQPIPAEYL